MPRRHDHLRGQRCSICGKRPPMFRHRGKVKRDRDHDMCLQCFRAHINRIQQEETVPVTRSSIDSYVTTLREALDAALSRGDDIELTAETGFDHSASPPGYVEPKPNGTATYVVTVNGGARAGGPA